MTGEPAKVFRKASSDESMDFLARSFFMSSESPAIDVNKPSCGAVAILALASLCGQTS